MGVWSSIPLPEEKFENMGAFGINTMAFVEWIQFMLLPVMQEIIKDKETLPSDSMISVYAVREFNGDNRYAHLYDLLRQLDDMANGRKATNKLHVIHHPREEFIGEVNERPYVIPSVLMDLSKIVPTLEGDFLEAQLQTFDLFLTTLPEQGRVQMANLLSSVAEESPKFATKIRLRKAAASLNAGETICKPYNHQEEIRKYQEQFKKFS